LCVHQRGVTRNGRNPATRPQQAAREKIVKRKVYANIKMTVVRQVEFFTDVENTEAVMEAIALEVARREWGDFDEAEIEEMDWADNPPDMIES
jgi:hypothetical protein